MDIEMVAFAFGARLPRPIRRYGATKGGWMLGVGRVIAANVGKRNPCPSNPSCRAGQTGRWCDTRRMPLGATWDILTPRTGNSVQQYRGVGRNCRHPNRRIFCPCADPRGHRPMTIETLFDSGCIVANPSVTFCATSASVEWSPVLRRALRSPPHRALPTSPGARLGTPELFRDRPERKKGIINGALDQGPAAARKHQYHAR